MFVRQQVTAEQAHAATSQLFPYPERRPAESTAAQGRDRPGSPAWVRAQQACARSQARVGHRAEQHVSMAAATPRQGPVVWMERVSGSALPATCFSDSWEQNEGAMNY